MDETRVLIIYSGGTIGMLESPQGKKTYPGFLFDNLKSQARFHDPARTTIFSHSRDIATFSSWRTNRQRQQQREQREHSRHRHQNSHGQNTPSVPSSREASRAPSPSPLPSPLPLGTLQWQVGQDEPLNYMSVSTTEGLVELPMLQTPRSSGKAVRYCIYEYERLIDSSDIGIAEWLRMAADIERNYQLFDAFIVLHGTDTMAYSASALSFLLESLGKPVILTGAQIPLSEVRNDAVDNLLGALAIAGNYVIPEVTLFFHHTLFRGCRSTKSSSFDFKAFTSPNMSPLARVGINIDVDWHMVQRPTALQPFRVHRDLCANVATLRLFPGITTSTVRTFLQAPIQGVILSTYGAGNCPQRKDLLEAFSEASKRGVVIVNVTQCQKGTVVGSLYENGRKLEAAGVIGGADMTIECALAKLSYLLSKDLTPEQVRELIGKPIRGELTPPKPLISELTSDGSVGGSNSANATKREGRMKGLFSRLLLISQPGPSNNDSRSDSGSQRAAGDQEGDVLPLNETDQAVAADTFNENDLGTIEDTLNPLLINAAASRSDATLKTMLNTLLSSEAAQAFSPHAPTITVDARKTSGRDASSTGGLPTAKSQGLSLLNTFETYSPLHTAVLHNIPQNVKLLLSFGASVHLRDIQGHTPLYYAAMVARRRGSSSSTSAATTIHAEASASDDQTAKHRTSDTRLEVVKMLREAGAHLIAEEKEELSQRDNLESIDSELWAAITGQPL